MNGESGEEEEGARGIKKSKINPFKLLKQLKYYIMRGYNVNIYFSEETYNKIKDLIAQRKVSEFVNQAVEKQLQKEEKRVKEQLKQQLIQGYQNRVKNKNLQKTLQTYGEMSLKDLNTKFQKKNGQPKK